MNETRSTRSGLFLVASVGLNLFLLGTMVPGWLHQDASHGQGKPSQTQTAAALTQAARELPPQDAIILKDMVSRAPGEPGNDPIAGSVEDMRAALRAEPFDPARLRGLLTAMAERRAAWEAERLDAFVQAVAAMSPEGRRQMADWHVPLRVPMPGPAGAIPPGAVPIGSIPPGAIPLDSTRGPLVVPLQAPPPQLPGNSPGGQ